MVPIFVVEEPAKQPKTNRGPPVGIDLGLMCLAVLSDGTHIRNPRHLQKSEEKLKRLQRQLSRKKRGSRNRYKAKLRLAITHEKVANTRTDFLHKLSSWLVRNYSFITLECLDVKDMVQEDYGKQINDAGWGLFTNMLCDKAESAGCKVVFVDPANTTKECSRCGAIVKKSIRDRTHCCPVCGLVIDRDLNASINILKRGVSTAGHAGSNACGDGLARYAVNEARSSHPLGVGVCHR